MKRVAIGISGGVDSAAAAALLKEQGYEVVGITFKFTDDFNEDDAVKVAKKLEIEHHVIDYRKEFKETIIDQFIADYNHGITPNPCVMCNKEIKLNLFKSKDENKDQTYFLCEVPKEILEKLILPLEGLEKDEVRLIAEKYNLEVAHKKDSTDVCFLSNTKLKDFLKEYIPNNPGKVINVETNEVMGEHIGLMNYTIGQRRGLNIGGTEEKMFVVGKDISKNILYICLGETNDYLLSTSCLIENVNYLKEEKVTKCMAKFRYRSKETEVELEWLNNNEVIVKYPQGIKSVTPGQACVFYNKDECLGGGIIKEVRKNDKKLWYV